LLLWLAPVLPGASGTALAQSPADTTEDDDGFDFDRYESREEEEEDEGAEEDDEVELDAEELEARWGPIEELRVSGKAGDTFQVDSAESSVQFDNAELEAMGVEDISDIGKITPNLEIRQSDATNANFFIRGVGLADFSANSASAVAIYQDGVPLNSSALQLVGLFDVSGVAVERGPQGAGSGRNATAGAIRINSTLPTGELQAKFRASYGTYWSDQAISGALLQDYEGSIETPVVDDLISARVSFRARAADPYVVNSCGGAPAFEDRVVRSPLGQPDNINDASICGERDFVSVPRGGVSTIPVGLPSAVNDKGEWAARGIIRFQPTVLDMDWRFSIQGGKLDQDSTLGQTSGTNQTLGGTNSRQYIEPDQREERRYYRNELGLSLTEANALLEKTLAETRPLDIRPYRGDFNRVGQTKRDTFGTSLNGTMFFEEVPFAGPVTLETITAFDRYSRLRDSDQDFSPVVLFERVQEDEAWQFYQELKATGENDMGTLRWELGGYYLMEQLESDLEQYTAFQSRNFFRTFDQDLWSFAFYAGGGWDFLEDFTLDAGVRYNWERKSFDYFQEQLVGGIPVQAVPQTETWTAPTGLISLTYRLTDEIASYAKYSRGWKGGHFNANRPNLPPEQPVPPADPETLDSVEVGLRGSWWDSRITATSAFFYYKYKDYQLFLFEPADAAPPILEIINANDVQQYGVEVELFSTPLQDVEWVPEEMMGLNLVFRFGWLESEFLDFVNLIERFSPQDGIYQQEANYTGNRLPNAPQFKFSGGAGWAFDLDGIGTITPRYDFDWTDDTFFGPNEGRGSSTLPSEELTDFAIGQPSYARHNLRLSYVTPDGTLEVAGWIRNVTDVRYKSYAFDASLFADVVVNFVGDPRTAGADISIRF